MRTSVNTTPAQLSAIKQVQADGTPQQRTVLAHLMDWRDKGLSQLEARHLYRIAALPRRIADLVEVGVPIRKARDQIPGERGHIRYSLDI
ncbi:helix-turn-helix domain-containing protein [Caulobacter segnis]|uniref:helix-turn-helix domain-containing protein n=1 Tax=Caulobacter segnis TaxID=88688 RepID=UPI0028660951|nr:helix-turn-helix domain-containing protein [Caulobacter segnis]MDR6624339.1 hypothetical protein [Caulobacter segnis]